MAPQNWSLLSKEDISPSKWFPLERHTVRLPNGTIVDDYYISTIGEVALILAVTPQKEIVLVEQYKHGIGQITIELPGGMRQQGQSLLQTAANELNEETGINIALDQLLPLGQLANNPTKTNQVTHGFICFNAAVNSTQKLDLTEDINVLKYPPQKVLDMIRSGEIWVSDSTALILLAALKYPELFATAAV